MDDNAGLVEALETDTRRDQLSEAFDAVEQQAKTPVVEAKPAVERVRAPDGKFAPGAPQNAAAKPVQADPAQTLEPVKDPVWKRPPASWKKDYHEVWATLDPRAQEYAFQREEQMKAGVQPLMEKARFADAMQQVIEPFMPTIRGLGIDAPRAVKALMEADHVLRTSNPQQKVAYFAQLAQQYGVNLGEVSQQPSQQVDPNYHALYQQLNQVRGEVLGWKEQQEKLQNDSLLNDITKFSASHEHFETVRPIMVQLLQSGTANDLDEAYEKAIRLDDTLFESIQTAKQAEALKNTVASKDRAAKQARSAAVSVRGSTPGTNTASKAQDRRSKLAEAFGSLDERL